MGEQVASDSADVRITLGGVPDTLQQVAGSAATWTACPGEWLQEMEGVGRYYLKQGREVHIQPNHRGHEFRKVHGGGMFCLAAAPAGSRPRWARLMGGQENNSGRKSS